MENEQIEITPELIKLTNDYDTARERFLDSLKLAKNLSISLDKGFSGVKL